LVPGGIAVILRTTSVAFVLALLAINGAALAQDNDVSEGQLPPLEQPAAAEQQPEKPKCVTSNTEWKEKGKLTTFEVELQNTCDMRLKCTVEAFVTGSGGQAQGHGTIVLEAAPKGQTTRNAYTMKVKSAGGMANVSHSCKSI
jgi:hypothetical protein